MSKPQTNVLNAMSTENTHQSVTARKDSTNAMPAAANVLTIVKNATAQNIAQNVLLTESTHHTVSVNQDSSMTVFLLNARNVMTNVSHVKDLPIIAQNVFQKEDHHQSVHVSQEPLMTTAPVNHVTIVVKLVPLMTFVTVAKISELHHQIAHVHPDSLKPQELINAPNVTSDVKNAKAHMNAQFVLTAEQDHQSAKAAHQECLTTASMSTVNCVPKNSHTVSNVPKTVAKSVNQAESHHTATVKKEQLKTTVYA